MPDLISLHLEIVNAKWDTTTSVVSHLSYTDATLVFHRTREIIILATEMITTLSDMTELSLISLKWP